MKPRLPRESIPPGYTEYDMAFIDLLGQFNMIMSYRSLSSGDLVTANKVLERAASLYNHISAKDFLELYWEAVDQLSRAVSSAKGHSISIHSLGQPIRRKSGFHERKMADPIYRRYFLLRQRFYDTLYRTHPSKRQELIDQFQAHPDYIAWKIKERKA